MLFLSLHVTRYSPNKEIPKNAFSTSCPEVEKMERFRMIPSITSQIFIVFMY